MPVCFMCDFPPSNLRGGSVLVSRLLSTHEPEQLFVLTGSHYTSMSPPDGRLACEHVVFPVTNETGRLGIGRLKTLLQWMLIPILAVYAARAMEARHTRVVVTVAHGHFFIAAALAAIIQRIPCLLIVHDDWVDDTRARSFVLKYLAAPAFRFVARHAAKVYTVSPFMQSTLRREYGVESELQMPATTVESRDARTGVNQSGCLRIAYAGTLTNATDDTLKVLVDVLKKDELAQHGVPCSELDLFVMATPEEARQAGWDHPRIRFHGWASQDQLARGLEGADILYLPYSFREDQRRMVSMSFPSKTADYLKAGKPIVVFAPPYAGVAAYAKEYGFAEVIDRPDVNELTRRIAFIANSPEVRHRLIDRAGETLRANHDINRQRSSFNSTIASLAGTT